MVAVSLIFYILFKNTKIRTKTLMLLSLSSSKIILTHLHLQKIFIDIAALILRDSKLLEVDLKNY